MAKQDEQLAVIVDQAVRDDRAQTGQRQKFKALEAAKKVAEKTKNRAVALYNRTLTEPRKDQIFTAVVTGAAGTFASYWGSDFIERKTITMVNEEGEWTGWRKAVVHGTFPLLGAVGLVGGCFLQHGLIAAGVIGLSAGLVVGSLLRSVLVDDETAEV